MHVVRKKDLIKSAAGRYAATYQRRGEWPTDRNYSREQAIYQALLQLPSDASEADVTTVVGHNRLTRNSCHQCNTDGETTVAFSHETHHMLDLLPVCPQCLTEALALSQD